MDLKKDDICKVNGISSEEDDVMVIESEEREDDKTAVIPAEKIIDDGDVVVIDPVVQNVSDRKVEKHPKVSDIILTQLNVEKKIIDNAKCLEEPPIFHKCYINLHNIADQPGLFMCNKCINFNYKNFKVDLERIKTQLLTVKFENNLNSKRRLQCNLCLNFYSSKLYLKYHACAADKGDDDSNWENDLPEAHKPESFERCEKISEPKPVKEHESPFEKTFDQNINLTEFTCEKNHINESNLSLKEKNVNKVKKLMPYDCDHCPKAFASKAGLRMHQPAHENKSYKCTVCGKVFKWKRSLRRHLSHFNGSHDCNECEKSFEHKHTSEPKLVEEHEISFGKDLGQNIGLNFKEPTCEQKHIDESNIDFKENPNSNKNKKLMPYACNYCRKAFASKAGLRMHQPAHENKSYECTVCGKVFKWKRSLRRHLSRVNGNHDCNECGKSFGLKSSYIKHFKSKTQSDENLLVSKKAQRRKESSYNCNDCGKSFKHRSLLVLHISTSHSSERSYVCTKCGKNFKRKSDLKIHYLTHTKPYVCQLCGKNFAETRKLIDHQRAHSGQWRYNCKMCGKGFMGSSHYKYHQSSKTACSYNNQKIEYGNGKFEEKVDHSGGKKYFSCNHCGKAFKSRYLITEHVKIHSNVRPYVCNKCGKAFKQYPSLYVHLKIHGRE